MKAWVLHDIAGPESFTLEEIETPEPGSGEVRVAVRTAALNHLDVWVSMGLPSPHSFPHIVGGDGAGVVDSVGDGVTSVSPGDEVIINPSIGCGQCAACLRGDTPFCERYLVLGENRWGTAGEFVVVPARNVVPKPETVDWEAAAAYPLAYGTAYRMLRRGRVKAGERVLTVGVGGGVSSACLVLAKAAGATVYVTSRSSDKIASAVELGAEAGFDSATEFSKAIWDIEKGVDVVLENVGPATFDQSMRSLVRRGGRIVVSGGTSGTEVTIKVPVLFFRQIEIIGSSMFDYGEFAEVTQMVASGRVPVVIDSVFDFADFPDAVAKLNAGEQLGKVVLRH